jgi:uncharacterized protein (TIGR02145 family)
MIKQRNHIGIISSFPLSEIGGMYDYNFTNSSNKSLGGIFSQKEFVTEIWGMIAGDANGDGQIDNRDKNDKYFDEYLNTGYYSGDLNMDGIVNNSDKILKWKPNSGKGWTIPISSQAFVCGNDLTDSRDGQIYNTVQIGTQCWMAENLNIGSMVLGSTNQTNNSTIEKYCYGNISFNCNTYGGLYQWNEMMQYSSTPGAQGICPIGWHLPTDAEWCILENEVDVGSISCSILGDRGIDAGGNLKEVGTQHWISPNIGATNQSGFTALPGGFRYTASGNNFAYSGTYAIFWTSTLYNSNNAYYRRLLNNAVTIYRYYSEINNVGESVRCVKN